MSKPLLVPIFSAAHVSKWDALPKDSIACTTQPRLEPERTDSWVNGDNDHDVYAPSESSEQGENVLSTRRECELSVRVAEFRGVVSTDRAGRVSRRFTKSRADSFFFTPLGLVADMANVRTYTWITLWFLLTAPVVLWDAAYCFMRPRSMVGGDLHWIWEPYGLYQDVDYVYGLKALEENNGFTNAQSLLNLVETSLNIAYVYLAHVSGWPGAPLVGFASATMTLSKTVLYWVQEYYCGGCAVGHNSLSTLLLLWVVPNGLWLVFPSLIMWRLGGDIISLLSAASQNARKAASGKTQ